MNYTLDSVKCPSDVSLLCPPLKGNWVTKQTLISLMLSCHTFLTFFCRHFILDENTGSLSIREGTPSGTYNLQVRVMDRTWPDAVSTVKVVVKERFSSGIHSNYYMFFFIFKDRLKTLDF